MYQEAGLTQASSWLLSELYNAMETKPLKSA